MLETTLKQFNQHIASIDTSVREALMQLDALAADAILFLVDSENRLIGSLTDGDLRRGFIKGLDFDAHLSQFIQSNPKYIQQGSYNFKEIIQFRNNHIAIFPVVNQEKQIINVVNFRNQKSYLPVDALIMAGGRGERLKPLTNDTPKPLLKVGDKPIIEHNIDRLNTYGIDDVWISLRYLGSQIESHFGSGAQKSMRINYVNENDPLGTAGALALVHNFVHDRILMMNSDLLTNIDFEEFYLFFEEHDADLAVACIPYQVNVPYAVMETDNHVVTGFKEKPTYTHYSNAGIYLMKREVAEMVPSNQHFNATDLMEKLINDGKKVVSFPFTGYWLDIGRHEDFEKAQRDIHNLKL
jgi:dTDP-glucose pyrophosphorylase